VEVGNTVLNKKNETDIIVRQGGQIMKLTENKTKELVERRKHKRFLCKNCAVSVNYKSGQIINISLGGFAFCYTHFEAWPQKSFEEGVLFGDNILLPKVPFDTVSDIVMPEASPGLVVVRQRGVRFRQLSSAQRSCLEIFLNRLSQEM